MKHLFSIFTVTIIFAMFFASCQKEKLTTEKEVIIDYENGIINIKNIDNIDSFMIKINQMDSVEYQNWKEKNNISITLYDVYKRARQSNDSLYQYYDNHKNTYEIKKFSDYTIEMANKGYLKLIDNDSVLSIEMPTWATFYAKILSPDSKVIINNKLYLFTENSIKIEDLLTGEQLKNTKKNSVDWSPAPTYAYITQNNKKYRIKIQTRYKMDYINTSDFKTYYVVYLSFYKKRGNRWVDKDTRWSGNGYFYRNFTSAGGTQHNSRENIYFSHHQRDNFINIVWRNWQENANEFTHTPKICSNKYNVSTLKGSASISHQQPSPTLK